MKYLDEFHDPKLVQVLVKKVQDLLGREFSLMEVCGTHAVGIFRYGIRDLFPETLRLLSGPGCPVCVTPAEEIDAAILLSREPGVILTTFGDMIKVPGSQSSLEMARVDGADVRVVYSALDALKIAETNPLKKVVFFGVGFETTSPSIASVISTAKRREIKNFWIYSCHKLIPPAMRGLLEMGEVKIEGFICPGHVSTIIGSLPYEFISKDFGVPCVISGFEPLDILQSIYMLIRQIQEGRTEVEIQYRRSVKLEGNKKALSKLYEIFTIADSKWRGIGLVPYSGLKIKDDYRDFDARTSFSIAWPEVSEERAGCICGQILRGISIPHDCPLFGRRCLPEDPVGPCMVSSEGACATYYKYAKWKA